MASPPPKKPRNDTSSDIGDAAQAPPLSLSALPHSVLDNVVGFLVDYRQTLKQCAPQGSLPPAVYADLGSVSKEWLSVLNARMSEQALSAFEVKITSRTRSHLLEKRRQLTLRRARLKALTLSDWIPGDRSGEEIWCALLSLAPQKLETLCVGTERQGAPADRLAKIVRAAAIHCPALQRLEYLSFIIKPTNGRRLSDTNEMIDLAKAVYDGMKVWAKHGGLKFVSFDMYEYMKGPPRAKEFFEHVASYCPNIEDLDGALTAVDRRSGTTSEEIWMLDIGTWERFCSNCLHLTEFNWVCVPFATRFFQIFGQHSKPKLQKLTISTPVNWNWRQYRRDVDESTRNALEKGGFAGSAKQAHLVLQSCPSLRDITVKWYQPRSATGELKINPEIFGDDFCEALARHCKKLTRLEITPNGDIHAHWSRSVATMTDRSLRALATLPSLESVHLTGLNVGGPGLFQLVVHHAADTTAKRQYRLALGDSSNSVTAMTFYQALMGFLTRLVDHEGELPCADRPVELHLVNMRLSAVDKEWSAMYFANIRSVAALAMEKHPTIRLRGLVRGHFDDNDVFMRIAEFNFSTGACDTPEWNDGAYEDEVEDIPIDSVFFKCKYLANPSDDGDDERRLEQPDSDSDDGLDAFDEGDSADE